MVFLGGAVLADIMKPMESAWSVLPRLACPIHRLTILWENVGLPRPSGTSRVLEQLTSLDAVQDSKSDGPERECVVMGIRYLFFSFAMLPCQLFSQPWLVVIFNARQEHC